MEQAVMPSPAGQGQGAATQPEPRIHVLVCEDEALTASWLATELETRGYGVSGVAEDGAQALELARMFQPDVILMDIRMPEMDGIEATRRLMAEHPVPIVAVTAYGDEEMVSEMVAAGAAGYLMKPVRGVDLRPAIETARARFAELRASQATASALEDALQTRKLLDRAKGILIDHRGFSEHDAHLYIHRRSRNERRPVREIAQEILDGRLP
jgi:two-component system, response regulator PdtaR